MNSLFPWSAAAAAVVFLSLSAALPAEANQRRGSLDPIAARSAVAPWWSANFRAERAQWKSGYANACAPRASLICPGFIVMGVAF